jgi:O-antigen ligase
VSAAVAMAPLAPASPAPGAWLARVWVFVLFSNLPLYLAQFVVPAIVPLDWILALFVLAALTLRRIVWRDRAPWFAAALTGYAALCLVWFVGQGGTDPMLIRERLLGVLVCLASYLVFASSPATLRAARQAVVWVVLLSAAVNFYDITHPFALIPADSEFALFGRASGFFINPNQSGAALVVGFALSVGVVPRAWRSAYLVAVMIGVAVTLSRAAILGLALVSLCLAIGGRTLSVRQLAVSLVTVGLLGWLAWTVTAAQLEARFNINPEVAADRLFWILDPIGSADYSQEEREQLVERGWGQFLASPWIGNGVGSTETWEARSSTHNEYVLLASDFGIVGLLVYPLIVLAALGFRTSWFDEATAAGGFLLFWGLFSHNILGEFYLLTALALVAALSGPATAAASAGRGTGSTA